MHKLIRKNSKATIRMKMKLKIVQSGLAKLTPMGKLSGLNSPNRARGSTNCQYSLTSRSLFLIYGLYFFVLQYVVDGNPSERKILLVTL